MATSTLKQLVNQAPAARPGQAAWLMEYRRRSWRDVEIQGLPGAKTEDWKYTSIKSLLNEKLLVDASGGADQAAVVPPALAARQDLHLAVLVNGVLVVHPSGLGDLPPGLRVQPLGELLAADASAEPASKDIESLLGRLVDHQRQPFAALNGAGFGDGLWLDLAPGLQLDRPLLVLCLTAGPKPMLVQPRLLIRVGAGARLTLLEWHAGGDRGHLVNQVTEISLADNASLVHLQLQDVKRDRLVRGTHVTCARGSQYRSLSVDLGGALVRNDLVVGIRGPGAQADADGLFFAGAGEHVDNHVRLDHCAPRGRSRALYKGLLAGGGRGVFNGKLIVQPAGRGTDARQVNHNLLLSRDVEIDAKPELEIYNDEVTCSHACSTGELESDQLFYLRSRGIDAQDAAALLVEAFASEISNRIEHETLRQLVAEAMTSRLRQLIEAFELP